MHVERIEVLGSTSLLAGLTSDIRNITIAFVCLPSLCKALSSPSAPAAYLAVLSTKMLLVTAVLLSGGGFVLVARVYQHMAVLCETEDKLYSYYQTVLEGHKGLTLNRERAE